MKNLLFLACLAGLFQLVKWVTVLVIEVSDQYESRLNAIAFIAMVIFEVLSMFIAVWATITLYRGTPL